MSEFHSILLRERFTIRDTMPTDLSSEAPVLAFSNRLYLSLETDDGAIQEDFVIRAQNMHSCTRMGAKIAQEFQENGPLLKRGAPPDWSGFYKGITKGYEEKWNPNRWIAVYNNGTVIFNGAGEGVKRHTFLDVIEQCDSRNKEDYSQSLKIAEDAFKQAGKLVTIDYESNIALILSIARDFAKCGIILRTPNDSTTFNFIAHPKDDRSVKISQCLGVSAAFMDGIQLAFLVGNINTQIFYEMIAERSIQARQSKDAIEKIKRLNIVIDQFESLLDVSYAPARPDLNDLIEKAAAFSKDVLSSGAGHG